MKNILSKKNIIIGAIIIFFLLLSVLLFILLRNGGTKYPEQPIKQDSILQTEDEIDLGSTTIDNQGEYFLWQISNQVKLEAVQDMVASLGTEFTLEDSQDGVFYKWSSDDDQIFYDITKNFLLFQYSEGIQFDSVELTDTTFSTFVNKYFKEDWKYKIFETEKGTNGETIYYAKRILSDDIYVESREHNQQTDYLALKDGKIVYGKILLTKFTTTDIQLPLISQEQLNTYLNLKEYPKEIYPQYSALEDSLLSQIDYLSDEFEELAETMANCKSTSSEVVYLYKSFDQELLTPVYKLDAQCELTYEEKQDSVPAIAYVNAIDPEYVYIPE
jgi:hypothetical protein